VSQNQPAIEVSHLRKVFHIPQRDPGLGGAVKALFRPRYAEKVAIDDISFSVPPGEIVGYIGVNGAGKSTTIKMLTGILAPTAGLVRVLGRNPQGARRQRSPDRGGLRTAHPALVGLSPRGVAQPHRPHLRGGA